MLGKHLFISSETIFLFASLLIISLACYLGSWLTITVRLLH